MEPVMSTSVSDVLASSLDSLATSIACGSTSMLEDTVASSLMLTNHGVASTLAMAQPGLGLADMDGREAAGMDLGDGGGGNSGRMEHSFADCSGELDGQSLIGGEEGPAAVATDATAETSPDMSGLGLQSSSLMLVNIPNANPSSLDTATLMPILVLSTGNGLQKGGGGGSNGGGNGCGINGSGGSVDSSLILDRPQQELRQLLRLRDLAHANLICATQESIAKSFGVNKNQTSTDEKHFKCEECGRSFKSSSHYRYHCETHKGNKVLKCPMEGCNKRFAWPAHLKYHTRTHENDRPYSCTMDDCGKTFYTVQSLHVHMRTHTGHKPFKCSEEYCGKSFTTAGNLKNHFRIHTGERPFICDHDGCIQSFAEHSSLRKHRLTHTGEKPYECNICFKVFSQSGSRNTHKRRHHSLSKMRAASGRGQGKGSEGAGGAKTEAGTEGVKVPLASDTVLLTEQGTPIQHEIGLAEITLPNPEHASSSLHTMSAVGVEETDINISTHASMPEHEGIALAQSMLGGVTLTSHQPDSGGGPSLQTEDQDSHMTMLAHESMTLSHSILEVTTDLDRNAGCKSDPTASVGRSTPSNVVVLTEPNHAHTNTHDHTLSMVGDPGQYPGSHHHHHHHHHHQASAAEDMVYNNAMLQSAATMSEQEHSDVDIPVSEIEVNDHHHHHHHHAHHHLQGSDIVITEW